MQGLRSLLESADGLRVVAADTTLEESIESVRELNPGILLVDKSFGVHPISEWIQDLRFARSPSAAVVWGAFISEPEAVRLLRAGASGVLRKTVSLPALLACLRTVAAGGRWVDEELVGSGDRLFRSGHSPLTAREEQVKGLVEQGLKNKDIAAALGISPGTVKIHLKHIFEKTGARGRYSLAAAAL